MIEAQFDARVVTYHETAMRDFDLLYVLPEFEVVGMSRPQYNKAPLRVEGLPPTVKLLEGNPVALYDEGGNPLDTYKLLREEFAKQCPAEWSEDEVNKHLGGYLKDGVCYTDHTDGKAWNQIVTCGNVLHTTGRVKRTAGELYFEILQLQADTLEQMKKQLADYPYLKTWSTISRRGHGGREVIPFPQCGGNDVPALLFCKTGTNWIRAARVRMLERDEPIPALYYP